MVRRVDASQNTTMSVVETAADRRRITRMAQGDTTALAELYDAHSSSVYALAVRVVGHVNDAEEIVQEVYTQAWRQAARYDADRATVIGWLLMMTRARALDALRARQSRPDASRAVALPDLPSAEPGQEVRVLTTESIEQVRQALGELTEPFRVPIELAYYEGLSQAEIAARLDQPLGTIKSRMRTALSKLRSVLCSEESR